MLEIIFKSWLTYFGTLFLIIACGYSLGIAFYWLGIGFTHNRSTQNRPAQDKPTHSSGISQKIFGNKYGN